MVAASFLFEQLATYGLWLLFVMAILETSFVTGLIVPSGIATSAATILALEGSFGLEGVVAAALAGGFIGDSIGFWIGYAGGERLLEGRGRWSKLFRASYGEVTEVLGRHPVVSVTVARMVSFVRTVMPLAAGMSRMSYRRYLRYEVVGLVLWAAIYVAMGLAGREGWKAATDVFGVGGALAFVVGTGAALFVIRKRRRGAAQTSD